MDWNNPTKDTEFLDVLTYLKLRDFDAASLFYSAPTNPQTGMIKYVRAFNKFQEYNGSSWDDKILAVAGGGTGAANAADARTNLGLGTLATQNSNAVSITGGSIAGVNLNAADINSGTLALARGGLGISLSLGLSGTYIRSNGTNVAFASISIADLPTGDYSGKITSGTYSISITGRAEEAHYVDQGVYTTDVLDNPHFINSLAATKLTGTLADARLSANVFVYSANSSSATAGSCALIQPSGYVTVTLPTVGTVKIPYFGV